MIEYNLTNSNIIHFKNTDNNKTYSMDVTNFYERFRFDRSFKSEFFYMLNQLDVAALPNDQLNKLYNNTRNYAFDFMVDWWQEEEYENMMRD